MSGEWVFGGSTSANQLGESISAVGGILPAITIAVAAPMSGRPYPYCVDQLVWVASLADCGLPGHWCAVCGDWVCGMTGEAASIMICLTSLGLKGLGMVPLSRAFSPAD